MVRDGDLKERASGLSLEALGWEGGGSSGQGDGWDISCWALLGPASYTLDGAFV